MGANEQHNNRAEHDELKNKGKKDVREDGEKFVIDRKMPVMWGNGKMCR